MGHGKLNFWYRMGTGSSLTWNETHYCKGDEEHGDEALVSKWIQDTAKQGRLAGKPPSNVAISLQQQTKFCISFKTAIVLTAQLVLRSAMPRLEVRQAQIQ